MNRRQFHRIALGSALAALARPALRAQPTARRPNFLIIMGDDVNWNDLPLYGGRNVATPNIDRLARQGLTFNNAFVTIALCVPCRTEMHTGQYPARNGCCWNHSPARPGTKSTVHYLNDLGYRVGLAGKYHLAPRRAFHFEMIEGITRNCVDPAPTFDLAESRKFIARDPDQPFCLVMGLTEAHVPWTTGDPENFDPANLDLPPILADTETTRREYAIYLAEIQLLDQQTGRILDMLDDTAAADDTLVIFTSEQGAQFPGCKWTNYFQGVHTSLIARWPGRIAPDTRTDAIVQYVDLLPTLIHAAAGRPDPANFDGRSFLPVLQGKTHQHRDHAFFMHNNVQDGPAYPIRSVTDTKFHYIRNLTPNRSYLNAWMMADNNWQGYWPTWLQAANQDEHADQLLQRFLHRPAEELYRLEDDPYELTNLANDPRHADIKANLAAHLDQWMQSQDDPGAPLDTPEAYQNRKREAQAWQQQQP